MMTGHRVSFKSTHPSLVEARHLVERCATDAGFSEVDVFDIVLAVGEACTNAILHAATDDGFWVACDYQDGALTVQVHDFGPGFSLEGRGIYVEPHLRKSGGLGIYIMRALMNEVTYDMNEDGTTVTLVKRANAGTP